MAQKLETCVPSAVPVEPLNVLVVDDSKMQRKLVLSQLKRMGFTLYEAASGIEALSICKIHEIDLILSDWIMPEMNGLEFCAEFRKMERDRYGYFILLTSKSDKGDVAEGLDYGADDFLSKPVNAAELRARIAAGVRVLDMEKQLHYQNERTKQTLAELSDLYNEVNKDLAEAEKLQKSLIPSNFYKVQDAEISNYFKSSGHVGGDLVGHFPIDADRQAIYSIDVSGHGVSSALLTIRLAGYLSPLNKAQNVAFEHMADGSHRVRKPGEIASVLNQLMLDELETELYFTLAFADVNLKTGSVEMVQAGHPHPVLFSEETGIKFLGDGGPPIGLISDLIFDTFEFTMNKKQKLLLYSDGVTECENKSGDLLDDDGLERILKRHFHTRGTELLNDIVWDLVDFAESDNFGDDLSAIMLEFKQN